MRKIFFLFFLANIMVPLSSTAQKGTVRIFCEIPGSIVYLDDALKGSDINVLDSVAAGSHYLKVTNDDVIIYGELINVNAGEVTTVLVKDTKEIRDKILASKYEEIQKYKEQKLDLYIDTRYVTQTTGASETKGGAVSWFPGYYSVSAKTENTTISTTFAVTDWFLVQGSKKITELQFANITGNQYIINAYKAREEQVAEDKRKANIRSRIAAGIISPCIALAGAGLLNLGLNAEKTEFKVLGIMNGAILIAIGTAGFILAIASKQGPINPAKYYVGNLNLLSFSEAEKQIKSYNQNLKKTLGLPIDFEPTE